MTIEGLGQQMALILFYLGKEPDTLDEFAKYWSKLSFALEFDGKFNTELIKTG
jgi:hypothetical protein